MLLMKCSISIGHKSSECNRGNDHKRESETDIVSNGQRWRRGSHIVEVSNSESTQRTQAMCVELQTARSESERSVSFRSVGNTEMTAVKLADSRTSDSDRDSERLCYT